MRERYAREREIYIYMHLLRCYLSGESFTLCWVSELIMCVGYSQMHRSAQGGMGSSLGAMSKVSMHTAVANFNRLLERNVSKVPVVAYGGYGGPRDTWALSQQLDGFQVGFSSFSWWL